MSEMSSFFSKMTSTHDSGEEFKLNNEQAYAIVEVVIPRMITEMPGLKHLGMKCRFVEKDDDGWTLRIDK